MKTISSRDVRDYLLIFSGSVIQAFSLNIFLVPADLVNGGVTGITQVINHFTGWPIGLMILAGNLPLFIIGWRYLGGKKFALRTVFSVLIYALSVDLIRILMPTEGITTDTLLNALYGGVINGVGYALVYQGRGTSGGTDILARILSHFRGIPISQSYLMTDAATIILGGLTFSWEKALYAMVLLYTSGISAETISQGSRVVRTALIITNHPQEVSAAIMKTLDRGVTNLPAKGMYTGMDRNVLFCVVSRPEVERLKTIVADSDPRAFLVIGEAYEALGEGFQPIKMD